jgi:hypothetical protein
LNGKPTAYFDIERDMGKALEGIRDGKRAWLVVAPKPQSGTQIHEYFVCPNHNWLTIALSENDLPSAIVIDLAVTLGDYLRGGRE